MGVQSSTLGEQDSNLILNTGITKCDLLPTLLLKMGVEECLHLLQIITCNPVVVDGAG